MNFTREQVESITQRVIQQLRQKGVAVGGVQLRADRITASVSPSTAGSNTDVANAPISIQSSIITEDVLVSAKVAGKTIAVSASAVVTPSGRDFMRQNSITVSNQVLAAQAAINGIAIVSADSVSVQAALKSSGWPVVKATTDFHAATEAARDSNSTMLCSVQQPSAAACLLNRSQLFRAAVVHPSDDLAALTIDMAPNVVCLNPKGWSIAALMTLLKQLSTKPNQPSLWKEIHSG